MVNNAAEKTCHPGCGWREAYVRQTEIVQAMMDESDQVFIKTRDMVRFMQELPTMPPMKRMEQPNEGGYQWQT